MNELWGRCLKSVSASARSRSLAVAYASKENTRVRLMVSSKSGLDLKIAKRNLTTKTMVNEKGTTPIGIMVTAREAACQSFCSRSVGKGRFHPAQ